MKTDYFSTFLDTVNNRTTKATTPPSVSVSAGTATMDINLILRVLVNRTTVPLGELVKTTDSTPGTIIPALEQLRNFGLIEYDPSGVSLTRQGIEATSSLSAPEA